jgi:hypothetical protein
MECDYRRALVWWPDLLHPLIQRVTTDYSSLLHTNRLVSTVTSSIPLPGSGFQRRTSPLFSVPELCPASATSFWQQRNPNGYLIQSQSHISTDGQSVSKSWCRASSGAHDQIFITFWQLRSYFCESPSLSRGRVCLLYMLLVLASVVFLGSKFLGLVTIKVKVKVKVKVMLRPTVQSTSPSWNEAPTWGLWPFLCCCLGGAA